jgi:hypothetical protein
MIYVCLKDPDELVGHMMPEVGVPVNNSCPSCDLFLQVHSRLVSNDITQLVVKGFHKYKRSVVLFQQSKGIPATIVHDDVFFDDWNAAKRKGLINAIALSRAAKFGRGTKCEIRIRYSLNVIAIESRTKKDRLLREFFLNRIKLI